MTKKSFKNIITSPTKWDIRFFDLCNTVASWSEDESRKVGCVIIGDGKEIRSTGYNGLPRGIKNTPSRQNHEMDEKYFWFEHSERNAIFNAVRGGTSLKDCRMYVNLFPCADCTRAIIQSGIIQLNTFVPIQEDAFFQRSFEVSKEMLLEAKVELNLFDIERITNC